MGCAAMGTLVELVVAPGRRPPNCLGITRAFWRDVEFEVRSAAVARRDAIDEGIEEGACGGVRASWPRRCWLTGRMVEARVRS